MFFKTITDFCIIKFVEYIDHNVTEKLGAWLFLMVSIYREINSILNTDSNETTLTIIHPNFNDFPVIGAPEGAVESFSIS